MRRSITATVIHRLKYSNSSLIFKLFASDIGLFSGILKGGLSKKGVAEIGDTVETTISRRGDDGLFMLSSFEILDHKNISKSLIKTALRDSALEIIIATVQEEHKNSRVNSLIIKFLENLKESSENRSIFLFWLFIYRLNSILGVGFSLIKCVKCNGQLTSGGELLPHSDGLVCRTCSPKKYPIFQPEALILLATGLPNPDQYIPTLSQRERINITTSLVDNLLAHFDSKRHIKSIHFLKEVI